VQIGPYRIEAEIGRGGAGLVYRAIGPQGPVALKLLKGQSEAAFARFQREVQLQAELTGAGGFVPILDAGRSPRGPYLVMPFLPGGTLRDRLRRTAGGLPMTELLELGEALASALGRAHAHGLVHRDLKPENVLFDHLDCPQIADLGLAKAMEATDPGSSGGLSKTGELRGTLGYMPPEQIQDSKRATSSSDVFALGAILYECATGIAAFSGEGALDVMDAISAGRYQDPRSLRPDLPKPMARLIASCLSTDPESRPPDGHALSQALATLGLSRPGGSARRALLLGVVAMAGIGAAILGYQAIRSGRLPSSSASPTEPTQPPASTPSPSLGRPAPLPSLTPSPLDSPRPLPARSPTPRPSKTPPPPPTWPREKYVLARDLDRLESIVIDEQFGQGSHRTTSPIQKLFLIKEESQLVVWDEDYLWTYSFPKLRLLSTIRIAFAAVDERRDPACVRDLSPDGRCFVTSVKDGAFVHSTGKGLRVQLPTKLAAAAAFSPLPLAALAAGERVTLVQTQEQELRGTLLHQGPVVALKTSPGSNRLLCATAAGAVHLWEVSPDGKNNEHKGKVTTLEGAKHLALGPGAEVWAAASPTQIRVESVSGKDKTLIINLDGEEPPTSIRFSSDGELLLIQSQHQVATVRLKDRTIARKTKIPATQACLIDGTGDQIVFAAKNSPHLIRSSHIPSDKGFKTAIGHVGAIRAIGHAPGGIVAGDAAGAHSYWSRGRCRYVRLTPAPISGILSLEGRTLIARWGRPSSEVNLRGEARNDFQGKSTCIAVGPYDQALVGEQDGGVRVIRGTKRVKGWSLHQGPVLGARLLPRKVVASWAKGEPFLLVSREGEVLHKLPHQATEVVDAAPLLGSHLAIGTRDGRVFVHDLETGRLVTKITAARGDELTCLTGHRSGRLLLTGDRTSAVRVFHWKKGRLKLREEIDLATESRDFLTYARQGKTLDDVYFGTARGVVLTGRWLPVKNK